MTHPVDLVDISVRVGRTEILRGLDLKVASGESVGIEGANGAGKTTLLRLLATLIRPASGAGSVLGARLGSDDVGAARAHIGLLAHEPAVYPELTLHENLGFYARLAGRPAGRVDELLDGIGLGRAAHRRAGDASQGMLRRVDLARLLLLEPTLVLLDEPHAGLDTDAEKLIAALIADVRARNGCAVVVSHDAARLRDVTGRRLRLDLGTLV